MGIDRQSLREEELIAGTYYTAIVEVDIVDEEPGADTVGLQGAVLLNELHVIFVEKQTCLVLGVGCHVMGRTVQ